MNAEQRRDFVRMFGPVLFFLILSYMMLTAMRDFRDNFSKEIWTALGYNASPELFTLTEIPIAIFVLIAIGSMIFIKNNKKALFINLYMILAGFACVAISSLMFKNHLISPPVWVIMTGFGLYLGYVPFNCVLFERLIAAFKISGTVGFVMYLADAFGYLGSVGVLLYKEFAQPNVSWVDFFMTSGVIVGILGIGLLTISIFLIFGYNENSVASSRRSIRPVHKIR